MALIKCYECKTEISDKAESCPHCGAKPRKTGLFTIALFFTAAVLGISAITPSKTTQNNTQYHDKKSIEDTLQKQNVWQYESLIDDASGKKISSTSILSNNSVNLEFPYAGGTYAKLFIRQHPRHGKDIYLQVNKGQLHCEYRNCYISIRYDDGNVIKNFVSEPSDRSNETFFLSNYKKTLNDIKKSKKMYVEVMFYSQGSYTFEFNTENLDESKLNP